MNFTAKMSAASRTALIFILFALVSWRLCNFLTLSIHALNWPYELDYAEGIVWQQTELMFSARAYGPIDGFPAIVFHYTPLYHTVVRALSWLTGGDMLNTGRAVSIVCTLLIAGAVGSIIMAVAPDNVGATARRWGGIIGGLAIFTLHPIMLCGPVMRADMLAIVLSFTGFWFGLKALERPKFITLAALCFVAAVYTKQTSLSAPAALFLVMLWYRPRVAVRGIVTCLILGGAILSVLEFETYGGFLRHIILYNIDPVDWRRVWLLGFVIKVYGLYFAVAVLFMFSTLVKTKFRLRPDDSTRDTVRSLCLIAYFFFTSITVFGIVKIGAFSNYFLEWLCICVAIVGIELVRFIEVWRKRHRFGIGSVSLILAPCAIAFYAVTLEVPQFAQGWSPAVLHQDQLLSARVRAATKPVISDEMVLLKRSGQQVLWEPMIFQELTQMGTWDEQPFLNRVRARQFAMFILRDDHTISPGLERALADAYPVIEKQAGFTIHLPAVQKSEARP